MERYIRKVVDAASEAKQLAIQHVGDPRQREPVRVICGCEGPGQSSRRHSIANVRIAGDIDWVVIVDEIVVPDLRVDSERRDQHQKVNPEIVWRGSLREIARRWPGSLLGWHERK